MRAVWYDRTGPAREVLQYGDRPLPLPAPGEVRVKLLASGVNPADTYRRAGTSYANEFPLIVPNSDGAGFVEALGEGADPALLGRRVWLYNAQRFRPFGTAAEYTCVPARLRARPAGGRGLRDRRLPRHPRHDGASLPVRRRAGGGAAGAGLGRRRRGGQLRGATGPLGRRGAGAGDGERRLEERGRDDGRGARRSSTTARRIAPTASWKRPAAPAWTASSRSMSPAMSRCGPA